MDTNVDRLAAASAIVSWGCSRYGYWAAPQPQMIAATAAAAVSRAIAYLRPTIRTMEARPASADSTTNGSPRWVSPVNRPCASLRRTRIPPRATSPTTDAVPSARVRNCSARSGSSSRSASPHRNTAAR